MNGVIAFLVFIFTLGALIFMPPLAAPYETLYGPVTVLFCAKALALCATLSSLRAF
jgi:hypothetical protein